MGFSRSVVSLNTWILISTHLGIIMPFNRICCCYCAIPVEYGATEMQCVQDRPYSTGHARTFTVLLATDVQSSVPCPRLLSLALEEEI